MKRYLLGELLHKIVFVNFFISSHHHGGGFNNGGFNNGGFNGGGFNNGGFNNGGFNNGGGGLGGILRLVLQFFTRAGQSNVMKRDFSPESLRFCRMCSLFSYCVQNSLAEYFVFVWFYVLLYNSVFCLINENNMYVFLFLLILLTNNCIRSFLNYVEYDCVQKHG